MEDCWSDEACVNLTVYCSHGRCLCHRAKCISFKLLSLTSASQGMMPSWQYRILVHDYTSDGLMRLFCMMPRQGRCIILEYNVYNDWIKSGFTASHYARKGRLINTEDSNSYNALTLLIEVKSAEWIRKKMAVYLNLKLA